MKLLGVQGKFKDESVALTHENVDDVFWAGGLLALAEGLRTKGSRWSETTVQRWV